MNIARHHRSPSIFGTRILRALTISLALTLTPAPLHAQVPAALSTRPTAPPPAVSEKSSDLSAALAQQIPPPNANAGAPMFHPASTSQYLIGEPTAEEQLYLELINRARMNPAAEALIWRNTTNPDILAAYGFFGVDVNLLASQIAALPVRSSNGISCSAR